MKRPWVVWGLRSQSHPAFQVETRFGDRERSLARARELCLEDWRKQGSPCSSALVCNDETREVAARYQRAGFDVPLDFSGTSFVVIGPEGARWKCGGCSREWRWHDVAAEPWCAACDPRKT